MTKEESQGLSEWMVELARKTPWEELSWSSDQSPDLQEPLKELRRIKGVLERANSDSSLEGSNLPSPLDPTAPGFSGFGTELDMKLRAQRRFKEYNLADPQMKQKRGLLNPTSRMPTINRYNPDLIKTGRSKFSPVHGLFQEI